MRLLKIVLTAFCAGLAFGAGLLAFQFAFAGVFFKWFLQDETGGFSIGGPLHNEETVVFAAPPMPAPELSGYLGSTNTYAEGFHDRSFDKKVLAAGEGEIQGRVTAHGEGVAGVRVRLALSGAIMSQWGTSGVDGIYNISAPHGEYQAGGFEIEKTSADNALPGLIMDPTCDWRVDRIIVNENLAGTGIDFRFVAPIKKTLEKNAYASAEEVALTWEPYPGAASYSVTLMERSNPNELNGTPVFDWQERPEVTEARLDLAPYAGKLKPGHYYKYSVNALDVRGTRLSETVWDHRNRYDFALLDADRP